MNAAGTIEAYYAALRNGDPLHPYFAERPDVVKFGVGERLVGYEAIADGLRAQTRSTEDWTVESQALRVTERDDHAWFSDAVFMSWTDTDADHEYALSTRWSGTMERSDGDWRFVGMHVSTPYVD
ncbi:AtzH-like domain-containing protein [Haloplanus halobius]|uniref:AtzH-like domain-containing protein n=1 Tax=Haloplanus halobius TaxID=2934938 RepID=UPI00200E7D26|nr:AtzH-like domain-containing protein [Haloplanus sp. XH21]